MSNIIKPRRSGGVIGTIGPIAGSGVFSLQERYALTADNYENVSLYLKMNGANGSTTFYDSSLYGHTVTANGNAQVSTAQSKFGGASAAFDGTGDYLSVAYGGSFDFSSGNWTIETWLRLNSVSGEAGIVSASPTSPSAGVVLRVSNNQIQFWTNGYSNIITQSGSVSTGQWYHVALVRNGSTSFLYVDGVQVASSGNAINIGSPAALVVGRTYSDTDQEYLNGYIDDLRITKGVARYTGSFTPPQREFRP